MGDPSILPPSLLWGRCIPWLGLGWFGCVWCGLCVCVAFLDYPGESEAGLPAGGGDAWEHVKDAANSKTTQSFVGRERGVFWEEVLRETAAGFHSRMGLDNRCQRAMSGSSDPESGPGASPLPPPPYAGEGALELRGSLDCWACAVLVTIQNLLVGTLNLLLVGVIFGVILFPAGVLLGFGFLCHSKIAWTLCPALDRVIAIDKRSSLHMLKFFNTQAQYCMTHLHDSGSIALLVVGFTLLVPLLVLALAAYCRMARRLQLGYCLIPYSKAVYKNMPASHYHRSSCCCTQDLDSVEKVWV